MTIVFSVEVPSYFHTFSTFLILFDNQTRSKRFWSTILLNPQEKRYIVEQYPASIKAFRCVYGSTKPTKGWEIQNWIIFSISTRFATIRPKLDVLRFSCDFQVKHWMDPQIIPYGWGLFSEGEEVRMRWLQRNVSHHVMVGEWKRCVH